MDILGTVEGLALPFEGESFAWLRGHGWPDATMEQFDPAAFDASLASRKNVKALLSHDHNVFLGDTANQGLTIWTDRRGLWFRLNIQDTQAGRTAYRKLQSGELCGCSVGFGELDYDWVPSGRPDSSKVKLITKGELRELSICKNPAYHRTEMFFTWKPARQSVAAATATAATSRPATRRDGPEPFYETTSLFPRGCGGRANGSRSWIERESQHRRLGVLWHKAKLNLEPGYSLLHGDVSDDWNLENKKLRLALDFLE